MPHQSALKPETSSSLLVAISITAVAVFIADTLLPLGIAIWVLYFVPVALSKFGWRPGLPLLAAVCCSVFIVAGYFLSPGRDTAAATFSILNRAFGFFTFWAAAITGRQFILSRLAVLRDAWLSSAQASLSTLLEGELSHDQLAENALGFLTEKLGAQVGAMYLVEADVYRRSGAYALDPKAASPAIVRAGEGLVGQVARDNRISVLRDVPQGYLDISSSVGRHPPRHLIIAPAAADGRVFAVVEVGLLTAPDPTELELFPRISQSLASAVRSANYRTRQRELLEETQRQAEELQAQQEELQTQQEELKVQNEELEQQSQALQKSQTLLENQQAELEQINSHLEEQTQSLETQKDNLLRAQSELQRANEYKSEFLANMSHELRTPLNSSLILAKLLSDNREGNLSAEQIKFAQTIYSAGNDLLTLINDILDLSKIEAGKLDMRPEVVPLPRVFEELMATFSPVAKDRHLELTATVDAALPATLYTDPSRLAQILKNLLSNALKFTEQGTVSLNAFRSSDGRLGFAVKDSGIGIPLEQQSVIFEAFRQADGTTNRKYGGTGLGLSISRDLARLLGGTLTVQSSAGAGSTFTLFLPERYIALENASNHAAPLLPPRAPAAPPARMVDPSHRPPQSANLPAPIFDDDRSGLTGGDRTILIIEDDLAFARVLQDLAHELDFRVLQAQTASTGLALAERYRPSAIVLDVGLPDRSGLSVLDSLKHNAATRHIPVHVASASDYSQIALEMGATGYAIKPVQREELVQAFRRLEQKFTQKLRRVLVVEDDPLHRESTCLLISGDDVECVAVGTAEAALRELSTSTFDCMILDLSLPDRTGFELLEDMAQKEQYAFPPVIVYTGRSLSREEEQQLWRFSSSIIIKGARSPERLIDEVTLFLHQVESELPPERQRMLRAARHRETIFEGRRVLIVEDDIRNIFALTSVLEPTGAKIEIARNGREALAHLSDKPGVDLVLMDIMMPEMDGLECMRQIRKQRELAKLPIIALTAKAMADDRDSCLAAGANDYIAKPLDIDKLLSLARVWMPK